MPRRTDGADDASRTPNVLRETWGNHDRKGTEMKVGSPLTALQLSQADEQHNHLKPKLIFFFLFSFFQASEEEDLKYLVTFVDGMGHKAEQSRGGINPNTQ